SCRLFDLNFFFFQAEDGIRDRNVTGVQTCALPIFALGAALAFSHWDPVYRDVWHSLRGIVPLTVAAGTLLLGSSQAHRSLSPLRSEERREGKSVEHGGRRGIRGEGESTSRRWGRRG